MLFKDLVPDPELLRVLEEMGYLNPTPIQEQAIPEIAQGRDLRASAQTGTGKTAAFLLPSLLRLNSTARKNLAARGPRILILTPTRELAIQVSNEAMKYSKYLHQLKTVCVYGGASYILQNKQLSRPYDILVATPGRLIDHIDRGRIDCSSIEILILDEADRMLDMGFIEPVEQIVAKLPKQRQTLLFSATLKGSVLRLSERLLSKPVEINVAHNPATHDNINQRLHNVDNLEHKYRILDHLLVDPLLQQAIVFTATKRHADELVDKLLLNGHRAAALHGDMNQRERTRTVLQLRQGNIRILVATDIAARGIDIPAISHVINFDLPGNVEDYVHRIGRTGRAGAKGIAFSFATMREMHLVRQIEQYTSQKMTPYTIPGMEPKLTTPSKPRPNGNSNSFGRKREPRRYFRK